MKLLTPLAILVLSSILFTSCRKDYSCKCSYVSGTKTVSFSKHISNARRNNAAAECKAFETANAPVGVTVPTSCKLY